MTESKKSYSPKTIEWKLAKLLIDEESNPNPNDDEIEVLTPMSLFATLNKRVYYSKNPSIYYVKGKHLKLIDYYYSKKMGKENWKYLLESKKYIEMWETCYNKEKQYYHTFIKEKNLNTDDYPHNIKKESQFQFRNTKNEDEDNLGSKEAKHREMSSEEAKHWEMDAYEYDDDPDKFDEWREDSGY